MSERFQGYLIGLFMMAGAVLLMQWIPTWLGWEPPRSANLAECAEALDQADHDSAGALECHCWSRADMDLVQLALEETYLR